MGFYDGLRGYMKWRDARNAQKKRFHIFLADGQALALEESIMQLRTVLNAHVERYHGGMKPPKEAVRKVRPVPQEPFVDEFPDPTDAVAVEKWITGV